LGRRSRRRTTRADRGVARLHWSASTVHEDTDCPDQIFSCALLSVQSSFESDLLHDSVQVPTVGYALQLVLAGVLESQTRTGNEVLHGLRH
jgi:hypothetical protein